MIKDEFDIVEFTDKNERDKLDSKEPPYATMPVCIEKKSTGRTILEYKDCLKSYARSYNPGYALKAGKRTKVFDYNPPIHNCCNFAEEALQACGLAHCFDLGKSSGLDSKAGPDGTVTRLSIGLSGLCVPAIVPFYISKQYPERHLSSSGPIVASASAEQQDQNNDKND